VAYEAYWYHTQQMLRGHPWATLPPTEQAHWEAAAQAVLAQRTPQKADTDRTPRCRWCGQPLAVHPQEGAPWRCRLSDGPRLPQENDDA